MDPVIICAFGASIVTLISDFGVVKCLIHELSQKRKEKREINKQQRLSRTLDESQDLVQREDNTLRVISEIDLSMVMVSLASHNSVPQVRS